MIFLQCPDLASSITRLPRADGEGKTSSGTRKLIHPHRTSLKKPSIPHRTRIRHPRRLRQRRKQQQLKKMPNGEPTDLTSPDVQHPCEHDIQW